MKRIINSFAVVLAACLLSFGSATQISRVLVVSGVPSARIPNDFGAKVISFEEIIAGSPVSVSIVIQGCSAGGTCDTLDTYTTVANSIRKPSIATAYAYFVITPTWSGGTNTSVTVNTLLSYGNFDTGGGGGGGLADPGSNGIVARTALNTTTAAAAADVTSLFSSCSGTQYLGFDGNCHTSGLGSVTSFSAGALSPLFTISVANPTTVPALSFSLSTAGAHAFLGNNTGSTAAPAYVQPAFTDISGMASSTQLPNPSASTLGGIESLTAVSHQWINAISTSGVPLATRPDFSDLTGAVDLSGAAATGILAAAREPAHTGDVTNSAGSLATTIATGAVTDAKASLAIKPAAKVVATTNQTIVSPSSYPTIDGTTVVAGDIVLLTQQTTTSQNGPWISGATGTTSWSRPTWYPTGGTVQPVQFATEFIRLGTVYQGTVWRMTTAGVTIDTSSQTWVVTPLALNASTVTGLLPPANGGTGADLSGALPGDLFTAVGGVMTRVPGPTTLDGVPQVPTATSTGGVSGAVSYGVAGVLGRSTSATSGVGADVVLGDRTSWVVYTAATAVASVLSQAGTAGFTNNFVYGVKVTGVGSVTITPTTSTINGNANLVVTQGQNCTIASLDNANYVSRCATGQVTAGSNITLSTSASGVSIASPAAVVNNAANTGTSAMTLDMSASTTANSLKIPSQAGLTSNGTSSVAYDTTAKLTHLPTNGADSTAVTETGTSTTTTQILHATAVAGVGAFSAIAAADMPAHTGDMTTSAGSLATTVKQAHWNETALTFAGQANPYPVASTDATLTCDASGGAVVITLPAATGSGRSLTVKKTDSSVNPCTPTRAGSDLIDGGASYSLTVQYASSSITDTASAVWSRTHVNQQAGDVTGISTATVIGAKFKVRECDISIGDGLNTITAATYPVKGCKNDTGATLTITGVQCYTDNAGTSTCDATTTHSGTPDILTGAVTGTSSFAAGSQSATTTVLNGEWLNASLITDGASKQIILHIIGTL